MPKVDFDGENKLIIVRYGETVLDVVYDIYFPWKAWVLQGENQKYPQALRYVGGDALVGGKSLAPYFFLMNGWKIKPAEMDHTLYINGNLFVEDAEIYGSNLTIPVDGYTVVVSVHTTSDAIVFLKEVERLVSALTPEEREQLFRTLTVAKFLALK